jgi:hypothetical protein
MTRFATARAAEQLWSDANLRVTRIRHIAKLRGPNGANEALVAGMNASIQLRSYSVDEPITVAILTARVEAAMPFILAGEKALDLTFTNIIDLLADLDRR